MKVSVDILLATYNGENYLREQIESIIDQSYKDWSLIARDDDSSDETSVVLNEYAGMFPDKIRIIKDSFGRLGPVRSFEQLLLHSNAPYVAFCDQDDVWLPEKLNILLEAIQAFQNRENCETPLLVHSDLLVVNDKLDLIDSSFWHYQHLNPEKMQAFRRMIVQNCVTGAATMVNRKLVDMALPIPDQAIMHDWWFALVAASQGRVININRQTVKYRQHATNDTGAKKWDLVFILNKLIFGRSGLRQGLIDTCNQAQALCYTGKINPEHHAEISEYVNMFQRGWFSRRITMIRMGFYKYGVLRNIAMLILL